MTQTLYDMVQQVFSDTDAMLKQASAKSAPRAVERRSPGTTKVAAATDHQKILKLASICEALADSLPSVVDDREPAEKLAEIMAVNEMLTNKLAGESIPPAVPVEGVESALHREAGDAPGESLDTDETGEATPAHISPYRVEPDERATPTDAPTALETNKGMMMPEQPEDVLKQSAVRVLQKIADNQKTSSVPPRFAKMFIKAASDVDNPANITGQGTNPDLQSIPGVDNVLSQGSEAGDHTPRYTAPTTGEGGGRELLSSSEAAIKAKKRQAKQSTLDALTGVLTEPAMSRQHDKILHESLVNTPEAGVKIAATRELLRKFSQASPEAARQIKHLLKQAQMPAAMPPQGMPPPEAQPQQGMPPQGMPPQGAVPPEMAQGAGVTPEELAAAQQLLEQQQAAQMAAQQQQQQMAAQQQPPMPAQQPPAGVPAPGQAPMGGA